MSGGKKKVRKNSNYVTEKDRATERKKENFKTYKYMRRRIIYIYIFAACGIAAFLYIIEQG